MEAHLTGAEFIWVHDIEQLNIKCIRKRREEAESQEGERERAGGRRREKENREVYIYVGRKRIETLSHMSTGNIAVFSWRTFFFLVLILKYSL